MKRIKHHCCFRLERGIRAGYMCGKPVEKGLRSLRVDGQPDTGDYCVDHAILLLDRWGKERAAADSVARDATEAGL